MRQDRHCYAAETASQGVQNRSLLFCTQAKSARVVAVLGAAPGQCSVRAALISRLAHLSGSKLLPWVLQEKWERSVGSSEMLPPRSDTCHSCSRVIGHRPSRDHACFKRAEEPPKEVEWEILTRALITSPGNGGRTGVDNKGGDLSPFSCKILIWL